LARKILVNANTTTKTINGIASAQVFEPARTTATDIAIAVAVKTTTNTRSDFHDSSS
jgi:hypothetical protein